MEISKELKTMTSRLSISNPIFSELIEDGGIYIDKTEYIEPLVKNRVNKYYFLSRPRRFGKSLLLNTIAELFSGKEKLFRGLYIHDKWNWSETYPVTYLDLSGVVGNTRQLIEEELVQQIFISARLQHKIQLDRDSNPNYVLEELICHLYKKHGKKVVILIDEYDTPILSNITSPHNAKIAKEVMHDFYKVLKRYGNYIRFVMLTGITKFSGISVFSALNNLVDISLDPDYSAICGYTENELEKYFKPFMEIVDRKKFREMYNGYNWLGETVYNPIDVMKAISDSISNGRVDRFKSFWFQTGTPTFLVDLMKQRGVLIPDLNENGISPKLFSEIDINYLEVEPLLFQTGYLTIDTELYDEETNDVLYRLKYPNKEVQISYSRFFLEEVFKGKEERVAFNHLNSELFSALKTADFQKLFNEIYIFFTSLSHRWYTNNNIANAEGFYCGIIFAILRSYAAHTEAESQSNHGQLDIFTRIGNKQYIIEIKVRENAKGKSPISQILEKGYAEKYHDEELYLVEMEFSSKERNIVELEYCIGVGGGRVAISRGDDRK